MRDTVDLVKLRANERNNSQNQCWTNTVGSCCVRVGSGVLTDATTPNNASTCSASWEGYNLEDLENMCNAHAWLQQLGNSGIKERKNCVNGFYIVALLLRQEKIDYSHGLSHHETKEMLGFVDPKISPVKKLCAKTPNATRNNLEQGVRTKATSDI